jgi:C1A family cysteine protease
MNRINVFWHVLFFLMLTCLAVCQMKEGNDDTFFLTAPLDEITGFKTPADYAEKGQKQDQIERQIEALSDAYVIQTLQLLPQSKRQEAFESLTGVDQQRLLKDPVLVLALPSIQQYKLKSGYIVDPKEKEVDFRKLDIVTKIKSQRGCAACWAFATIAAFESSWAIRNDGELIDASEQDVLNCSRAGDCSAGHWAFDYLITTGVPSGTDLPYQHGRGLCDSQIRRIYSAARSGRVRTAFGEPPSVEAMKQAMATYGPIAVAMTVNDDFRNAKAGQVYSVQVDGEPNHAMLLVGWSDTMHAWLAKNSYGPGFCEHGFIWIKWGCSKIGWNAAYVVAQTRKFPIPVSSLLNAIP